MPNTHTWPAGGSSFLMFFCIMLVVPDLNLALSLHIFSFFCQWFFFTGNMNLSLSRICLIMNLVILLCIDQIPCRSNVVVLPLCAKSWTLGSGGREWGIVQGVVSSFILFWNWRPHQCFLFFFQVHAAATRWLSRYAQVFSRVVISKPNNLNCYSFLNEVKNCTWIVLIIGLEKWGHNRPRTWADKPSLLCDDLVYKFAFYYGCHILFSVNVGYIITGKEKITD